MSKAGSKWLVAPLLPVFMVGTSLAIVVSTPTATLVSLTAGALIAFIVGWKAAVIGYLVLGVLFGLAMILLAGASSTHHDTSLGLAFVALGFFAWAPAVLAYLFEGWFGYHDPAMMSLSKLRRQPNY